MTLFLIFAGVACAYLAWLMFRLAVHALPVLCGLVVLCGAHDAGVGYPGAILAGLIAGFAVLYCARAVFPLLTSPLPRLLFSGVFALPTGLAGYYLVQHLTGLVTDSGSVAASLSALGALTAASASLASLRAGSHAMTGRHDPAKGQAVAGDETGRSS